MTTRLQTIGMPMRYFVAIIAVCAVGPAARAQLPDHPIITEVYTNPDGTSDGPVGRDVANLHQEYIEIYLPPSAALRAGLNKDALRLAFCEVEGDSSSSGNGLVNYRIDLPTFDLDAANGITPGAASRPASGIVVLGWVDYVGNPPIALAGTPTTRVALIAGGVTATADFTFVAINGGQFSGTTNFPISPAVSSIDLPGEASSGIIQNGSGAYLLVDRDSPGYVQLYDDGQVPIGGSADPALPNGAVLQTSALLDAFAGNDHGKFLTIEQPYDAPTGDDIDLETVLPLGGAFSRLVAQVAAAGGAGYLRNFLDVRKTTEDPTALNDDPVDDAINAYRVLTNAGPFFPTPGRAPATTSPPELSVAAPAAQAFDVLSGTTGRPGIICANLGGNFALNAQASPGASTNPAVVTAQAGNPAAVLTGQTIVFPTIAVTAAAGAAHGALASIPVNVAATGQPGDPPVVNPTGATTATIRVVNPTTGLAADGAPYQATALVALYGLPNSAAPAVTNEFLGTSLSSYVADHLGGLVDDERHNGLALLSPATDLSNPVLVDVMEDDMPDDPALFINALSTAGTPDLVTTILTSPEVLAGNRTYDDNFNVTQTAVRALRLNIAETRTSGGPFVPAERVHYVGPTGVVGAAASGLTSVTTTRGFELALLDSNVQQAGTLESGETDDFGLVVEVGRTRPGAQVLPGEFVFLSFQGGLAGADVDSVNVPPLDNQTVIIYVDLDPLDAVLGCETITQLFVIDGSGGSVLNVIEAFSLNVRQPLPFDADDDGDVDLLDYAAFSACLSGPALPAAPGCAVHDGDTSGTVDLSDYAALMRALN